MSDGLQRFLNKIAVDEDTGCWNWCANKLPKGYGQFWFRGTMRNAPRVSYEMFIGPIPEGLQIDHLCRNPSCVNPYHLEPVTGHVNQLRGKRNQHRGKTHCPLGHPLSGDNLYLHPKDGFRDCRLCRQAADQRWRLKRREAQVA